MSYHSIIPQLLSIYMYAYNYNSTIIILIIVIIVLQEYTNSTTRQYKANSYTTTVIGTV